MCVFCVCVCVCVCVLPDMCTPSPDTISNQEGFCQLAFTVLSGVKNTWERERSQIIVAVSDCSVCSSSCASPVPGSSLGGEFTAVLFTLVHDDAKESLPTVAGLFFEEVPTITMASPSTAPFRMTSVRRLSEAVLEVPAQKRSCSPTNPSSTTTTTTTMAM